MGAPKNIIKEVLQLLNDYIGYEKDKKEPVTIEGKNELAKYITSHISRNLEDYRS